tara:strand:+ start:458 stop:727 length:270 start_codon:yes stop_codon:yes gene_type:complete
MVADTDIRSEILRLTGEKASVAPRDVAQALAGEGDDWRKFLPRIRAEATVLHGEDQLVFVRKRKIVPPEGLKGVYRLARPAKDEDSQPQ